MVHKNRNPLAWILLGILFFERRLLGRRLNEAIFSFAYLPFSRFLLRLHWIFGFRAITNLKMIEGRLFSLSICMTQGSHRNKTDVSIIKPGFIR